MMGYVYRIDFPDGYFYIGKTEDIKKRISRHFSIKKGVAYSRIAKYCHCAKDLMKFVTTLYCGEDYSNQEFKEINAEGDDSFLLNKDLVDVDIFREKSYTMGLSMVQLSTLLGLSFAELSDVRRNSPDVLKKKLDRWDNTRDRLNQIICYPTRHQRKLMQQMEGKG